MGAQVKSVARSSFMLPMSVILKSSTKPVAQTLKSLA